MSAAPEPEERNSYPAHLLEDPAQALRLYERYGLATVVSGDDTARLERAAEHAVKVAGELPAFDRLWEDVVSGDYAG